MRLNKGIKDVFGGGDGASSPREFSGRLCKREHGFRIFAAEELLNYLPQSFQADEWVLQIAQSS